MAFIDTRVKIDMQTFLTVHSMIEEYDANNGYIPYENLRVYIEELRNPVNEKYDAMAARAEYIKSHKQRHC